MLALGRDVLDKELLDAAGLKGGKVDDLLLEVRAGERPIVRAIITGQGATAMLLGTRIAQLARWCRRAVLGYEQDMPPITIEWKRVTRIDVTIHIDVDREEAGLLRSEQAVWERWIRHLPWAQR